MDLASAALSPFECPPSRAEIRMEGASLCWENLAKGNYCIIYEDGSKSFVYWVLLIELELSNFVESILNSLDKSNTNKERRRRELQSKKQNKVHSSFMPEK